jgi:hypothetical protein
VSVSRNLFATMPARRAQALCRYLHGRLSRPTPTAAHHEWDFIATRHE